MSTIFIRKKNCKLNNTSFVFTLMILGSILFGLGSCSSPKPAQQDYSSITADKLPFRTLVALMDESGGKRPSAMERSSATTYHLHCLLLPKADSAGKDWKIYNSAFRYAIELLKPDGSTAARIDSLLWQAKPAAEKDLPAEFAMLSSRISLAEELVAELTQQGKEPIAARLIITFPEGSTVRIPATIPSVGVVGAPENPSLQTAVFFEPDGQGATFYNVATRFRLNEQEYFPNSEQIRLRLMAMAGKKMFASEQGAAFMQMIMPILPDSIADMHLYSFYWSGRDNNGAYFFNGPVSAEVSLTAKPSPYRVTMTFFYRRS